MKVLHRKELKSGKRHVLVELDPNETLLAFDENAHYKTGYPHEEILCGRHIIEAEQVKWCVLGQEWVS